MFVKFDRSLGHGVRPRFAKKKPSNVPGFLNSLLKPALLSDGDLVGVGLLGCRGSDLRRRYNCIGLRSVGRMNWIICHSMTFQFTQKNI